MKSLSLAQEFVRHPSPAHLRAWQIRMGYTYDTAAEALGVVRSTYGRMLAGATTGKAVERLSAVDRRTALACLAIEMGLSPVEPPEKENHRQAGTRAAGAAAGDGKFVKQLNKMHQDQIEGEK